MAAFGVVARVGDVSETMGHVQSNMSSRWLVVGMLTALGLAGPTVAAAGSGPSLRAQGPKSVNVGADYTLTATGRATSKANFLRSNQTHGQPCKGSYKAEKRVATNVGPAGFVRGKFSRSLTYASAGGLGTWYFCAYLTNKKSKKTYARSTARFTVPR